MLRPTLPRVPLMSTAVEAHAASEQVACAVSRSLEKSGFLAAKGPGCGAGDCGVCGSKCSEAGDMRQANAGAAVQVASEVAAL